MNTTIQRLGLPEQLTRFNGILSSIENVIPAIDEKVTRRFDRIARKWVSETTRTLVPYKINGNKWMAYNHLAELVHGHGFVVSEDGYTLTKEAQEFVAQEGPFAGNTYRTGKQTMTYDRGEWVRRYHDPYRNAGNDGLPHEGLIACVVINTTTFDIKPTPRIVKQTYNRTFTRSEMEAMGFTTEMLGALSYQRFELQTPSEETHLLNVSTDLEQLDENVYWPNVYFNGKDDNSFDFQRLIPFYAFKVPDFEVRITAYGDVTTADYEEPNYSGLGNAGKWLDRGVENELVKPIRIEYGPSYSVEDTADELVLTFKEGASRAAIGVEILYKGTGGKGRDHFIGVNLLTGEKFWSIFALNV